MKETTRRKPRTKQADPQQSALEGTAPIAAEFPVDSGIVAIIRDMAAAGLNPESALDLLARLMAEVPAASKDVMDKIKMIDGLIKTSRSMMEIKIKNDDVAAMMDRLDQLEIQIDRVAADKIPRAQKPREVWNKPDA